MHPTEIPNHEWYAKVSQSRASASRCPFATVEACPRYYQSLSLLGKAGSTEIPEKEDKRLLKHWKSSDLWPRTAEQATSVMGESSNPSIFSNFCPEVTFERFRLFATSLTRYADEIDSDIAHKQLSSESAPAGHPGWSWSSSNAQHFTDCQIHAVLSHRAVTSKPKATEPWWREHLAKIVVAVVVAIATAVITKSFA
jgi:hypothetical protein